MERSRPTRVIQFGEGNFLRAFVDWQIQKMNDASVFDGGVAMVQPRAGGHVGDFERQGRRFTVLIEGMDGGQPVARHDVIDVVNCTVDPYRDWAGFLALADDPAAAVIVSNTTEAGIAVDPADTADDAPPMGFPAKLAHLLKRRFDAGLPGFLVLPCELIDDNGPALKAAVLECVRRFGWDDNLARWIGTDNRFRSTLVDRIVPGFPADRAEQLWAEWGYRDELAVKAEPYGLWAIEATADDLAGFPVDSPDVHGLEVVLTDDLRPYHDRKVYLLNGPHTTMAQLGSLAGLHTVGEAMADADLGPFIKSQMRDEIAPVIDLPRSDVDAFAAEVVERFENPSIVHSLEAIALNSVAKFRARLLPVVKANILARRGLPPRTCAALAGLLVNEFPPDCDVRAVLADANLWGGEMTAIPGIVELVVDDIAAIRRDGVRPLLRRLK